MNSDVVAGKRVLVVDDQPHVIRVIRMTLERNGYNVDTASNGAQALDKLTAAPFDVLITDVDMPQMNGRELCDRVHAQHEFEAPLTLVVTGSTEPELRDWAESLARTYFLEKPLSLKSLLGLLNERLLSEIEA